MRLTLRGRRLVAGAAMVAGAAAGMTAQVWNPYTRAADAQVREVFEDEPGWDCHTMGNRDCGRTDTSLCGPVGGALGCPVWRP